MLKGLLLLVLLSTFVANSLAASKGILETKRRKLLSACKRYQQSDVSAYAEFEGFGLPVKKAVVTNVVDFVSSNPEVASVVGNTVYGESVGYATISIATDTTKFGGSTASTIVLSDSIEVTDTPTVITSLSVAAITDVEAESPANSWEDADSAELRFVVGQYLRKTNDTADIVVYANFDDGHYADVTDIAHITSLNENISVHTMDHFLGQNYSSEGEALGFSLDNDVVDETSRLTVLPSMLASADGYFLLASVGTCCDQVDTFHDTHSGTQFVAYNSSGHSCRQVTGLGRVKVELEQEVQKTAVPSAAPTSTPSGVPTRVPSQPTSLPTAPTSRPTYIPTTLPPPSTVSPTSIPSPNPTALFPTTDDDSNGVTEDDALRFEYLLHPEFSMAMGVVNGNSGGNNGVAARQKHDYPTLAGRSKWSIPYVLLPGTSALTNGAETKLTISGRVYGTQTVGRDVLDKVNGGGMVIDDVHAVLMSGADIYATSATSAAGHRSITVAYQLRDQRGSTSSIAAILRRDKLQLQLRVSINQTSAVIINSFRFDCQTPAVVSGIGLCDGVVPLEWFSVYQDVGVSAVVEVVRPVLNGELSTVLVAASTPLIARLVRVPTYASAALSAGAGGTMTLQLPAAPVIIGVGNQQQHFTVPVLANTGGHICTSWAAEVSFDHTVVHLVSVAGSDLFTDPVTVLHHHSEDYDDFQSENSTEAGAGGSMSKLFLSSSGPKAGVNDAQLIGTDIVIALITFAVRTPLPADDSMGQHNQNQQQKQYKNVMSIFTVDMVNVYSLVFATQKQGWVHDHRHGGPYHSGELLVIDSNSELPVALFAYPTSGSNELLNTGSLSRTAETTLSPITVMAVYNTHSSGVRPLVDVTASSACSVDNNDAGNRGVLSVRDTEHCVAFVPAACQRGSAKAHLDVLYGGVSTSVRYRVWCPMSLHIHARDKVLNSIGARPSRQQQSSSSTSTTTPSISTTSSITSRVDLVNAAAAAAAATTAAEYVAKAEAEAAGVVVDKLRAHQDDRHLLHILADSVVNNTKTSSTTAADSSSSIPLTMSMCSKYRGQNGYELMADMCGENEQLMKFESAPNLTIASAPDIDGHRQHQQQSGVSP